VWLDVGASTGGFTDCLLQRGAARVYAVDVGRALLAESLRRDPRVICREGQNARHLTRSDFPEPIQAVVVDASFIGLDKLLPAIGDVLSPGGWLLAMIKPQFEAGKQLARRHRGVIANPELRARIVEEVVEKVVASGFEALGRCDSELPGPKGNVEHFLWAARRPPG
jgi:23S rRNA (cytidine1920-2'-O)/16S rRNA (cytidine1409-2'-O)-methyltransferase